MKVTAFTRRALRSRRQERDLCKSGWHYLREPIWQLHRGGMRDQRIVAVEIGADGKSLFVKCEPAPSP